MKKKKKEKIEQETRVNKLTLYIQLTKKKGTPFPTCDLLENYK